MIIPRMQKPITAVILMMEKTNSASPYPARCLAGEPDGETVLHTSHAKEIDKHNDEPEDHDKGVRVDGASTGPVRQGDACSRDLEW